MYAVYAIKNGVLDEFKEKVFPKHWFSKHEMSSSASKKLSPFRLQASLLLAIIASTQIAARF